MPATARPGSPLLLVFCFHNAVSIDNSIMGSKNKRQREEETAVFVPKRPAAPHAYLNKHKKRDKALEVVFDPKAHKWVFSKNARTAALAN